jgi:transposase
MGLMLAIVVPPAHGQDRDGAPQVLETLGDGFPRLTNIWAGGYAGQLVGWLSTTFGWGLAVIKRREKHKFEVLPRRWGASAPSLGSAAPAG